MTSVKPLTVTELPTAAAPTVGAQLRRARELRGLSVSEVAQQLRLSEHLLTALEQENQAALPAPVYVRGYVRHYARLLHLDAEALVALYPLRASPVAELACVQPVLVASAAWRQAALWQGGGVFGLLLILGLPLAWWHAELPLWFSTDGTTAAAVPETAWVARGIAGSQTANTPVEPAIVGEPAPVLATELNPNPALAPVVLAAAAPPVVTPAAEPRIDTSLKLTFKAKAWVEVRDAQGQRLLKGVFKAGTEQQLTGTPPLQLTLTPATAVTVHYAGQVVPVPSPTKGQRAKFHVGQP